jgi:uncharacterized protein (TIGR02145 family)
MKKLNLTFVFCLTVFFLSAQDITINFKSKADTFSIDSIQAINLRTNQIVKLLGGESLLLVKTPTGINPVTDISETGYIYPNPADEDAAFFFSTDKNQEVEIRLYNSSGQILKQNKRILEQGMHRFELKFPVAGIYFLSVLKSEGKASFKAIYTGSKIQTGSIQYSGSEKLNSQKPDANQLKHATINKTLTYSDGDFIQYSVISGVNTTILTETPSVSKAFDVEFVNCIDKDKKSYKVVKIGSQWWMAENLAWLPVVSGSKTGSDTEPFYYVYGYEDSDVAAAKTTSNYKTYGVLYNWPAAKAACPPGWHLPSDAEWTELENYLIANGFNYDGTTTGNKIAKSLATTTNWSTYSGTGAIGNNLSLNNKSGFSALPGGYRYSSGHFDYIGDYGNWWSSTEASTNYAWSRALSCYFSYVYRSYGGKEDGFSVRCVRD